MEQVWERDDDVRTFLTRCSQHRLGALFEIAVLTGHKRGELCGLRWSEVDLAARKITVRRSRALDPSYVTRLLPTLRRGREELPP